MDGPGHCCCGPLHGSTRGCSGTCCSNGGAHSCSTSYPCNSSGSYNNTASTQKQAPTQDLAWRRGTPQLHNAPHVTLRLKDRHTMLHRQKFTSLDILQETEGREVSSFHLILIADVTFWGISGLNIIFMAVFID